MRILVTGGTGVIGEGTIPELITRGHTVRLFSRNASADAVKWPGVEAVNGDVSDTASVSSAATGCDAILHVAGIAAEQPPHVTFEKINIGGTEAVIAEAKRAGVRRFVFVSSLGADVGESDYHRSKREAERLVERSGLDWTIIRPGNVYGPGDETVSAILKMVRSLPAVPVIDDGAQEFQPIWHEDLAKILCSVLDRDDLEGRILEAAGEATTMNDLLARFAGITGREPARVPLPGGLVQILSRMTGSMSPPVDENKLTMLREENVVRGTSASEVLGITTTPLAEGLRALADVLPETTPDEGIGALEHKHFHADIRGSRHTPATLMSLFEERVTDLMPIEFAAEPGAPTKIGAGVTMTASLPLRGHIQVRVEVLEPTRVVFATIEGHPLSGIVEFTTAEAGDAVRFSIDTYTRAASILDWLAMKTVGAAAQTSNWRNVVQNVVDASGGTSEGVVQEKEVLDDDQAEALQQRIRRMVDSRKRDEVRAAL